MARRGGGFPGGGGMGNMNNLMKQAQKMQRQMEENQKAMETKEFTAKAGGGARSDSFRQEGDHKDQVIRGSRRSG